jgi:ABC-2 type transport system ATP-binding protein
MIQEAAIEMQGLTKFYGKNVGVKDLDLAVRRGEIFGFLGPNGAGKTTAIRLLLDLIRPTFGKATILGMRAQEDSIRIREVIGNLPGEVALYDRMTGREHLDFVAGFRTRKPVLRDELLAILELRADAVSRRVRTYSKGMRQKLAIVIALQHDPDLLILDEPTEGLDPLVREAIFGILGSFKARGKTVFMSSHNLAEVEKICDRVAVVREGSIVAVEDLVSLTRSLERRITVRFADEALARGFFDGKGTVTFQQGGTVTVMLEGDVREVLARLAKAEVLDVEIGPPDLECYFLDFYRGRA